MKRWMTVALILSVAAGEGYAYTHEPKGTLGARRDTQAKRLSGLCMDGAGNIVTADEVGRCVRVIAPDDTLKALWKLDFAPQAISWRASDKTLLVAGSGCVAVLDAGGKAVCSASLPKDGVKGGPAKKSPDRATDATSVTSSGDDVFVTFRASTGYSVLRLDKKLENPKTIITGLRGCCGQMDVMAFGDTVYVAANCAFEVSLYDRDGK